MILVKFPHTLEDEDEAHAGQDEREDDEDHHQVRLVDGGLRLSLYQKRENGRR